MQSNTKIIIETNYQIMEKKKKQVLTGIWNTLEKPLSSCLSFEATRFCDAIIVYGEKKNIY